jgi:hypothetical protein
VSHVHEGRTTTGEPSLVKTGDAAPQRTGDLLDRQQMRDASPVKGDDAAPNFLDRVPLGHRQFPFAAGN